MRTVSVRPPTLDSSSESSNHFSRDSGAGLPREKSYDLSTKLQAAKQRQVEGGGDVQIGVALESQKPLELADEVREIISDPSPTISFNQSTTSYVALQEWEGFIDSVNDGVVNARLLKVDSKDGNEGELAEIPIEEFNERDRDKLRSGMIFRWAISSEKKGGTQRHISQIVLRQLPQWTLRELSHAGDEGRLLMEIFKTNDEETSPPRD